MKPFFVLTLVFILSLLLGSASATYGTQSCVVDARTVLNLDWHPSGQNIAFGSNCGVLLVNPDLSELIGVLPVVNGDDMGSIAYNHDGSLIAASVGYIESVSEIKVWNTAANRIVRTITDQFSSMPIAWHPSQDIFVFGYTEEMLVFDVQSNTVTHQFMPTSDIQGNYPYLACWSPLGSFVILRFASGGGYLLTFPSWEVYTVPFVTYYGGVCSPDLKRLGSSSGGFYDLTNNTSIAPDVGCNGVSFAWRTEGAEEHAVNCDDLFVRVYDRESRLRFTLEGSHTGRNFIQAARSIEYSPDGSRLIALGNDGVVRLWETTNYELITRVNVADFANLAFAQR